MGRVQYAGRTSSIFKFKEAGDLGFGLLIGKFDQTRTELMCYTSIAKGKFWNFFLKRFNFFGRSYVGDDLDNFKTLVSQIWKPFEDN